MHLGLTSEYSTGKRVASLARTAKSTAAEKRRGENENRLHRRVHFSFERGGKCPYTRTHVTDSFFAETPEGQPPHPPPTIDGSAGFWWKCHVSGDGEEDAEEERCGEGGLVAVGRVEEVLFGPRST